MRRLPVCLIALSSLMVLGTGLHAQECPEEPPLLHYTGATQVVCPCFVVGEEAGAVFDAPIAHYPIEILRIGIAWGSQLGGSPQSLEQALKIYPAGLPNPGVPIFTLPGPLLNDGFFNEFDLEPLAGEIEVASGPFSVTLEFLTQNAGDPFAPSVVHDGNGCQAGRNLVKAIPGGWFDACVLGVTGDWVFYAVYRQVDCGPVGVGEEHVVSSRPVIMNAPRPNPSRGPSEIEFVLADEGTATLDVFDPTGRRIVDLAHRVFAAGRHTVRWDGRREDGVPVAPGIYFVVLQSAEERATRKLVIER